MTRPHPCPANMDPNSILLSSGMNSLYDEHHANYHVSQSPNVRISQGFPEPHSLRFSRELLWTSQQCWRQYGNKIEFALRRTWGSSKRAVICLYTEHLTATLMAPHSEHSSMIPTPSQLGARSVCFHVTNRVSCILVHSEVWRCSQHFYDPSRLWYAFYNSDHSHLDSRTGWKVCMMRCIEVLAATNHVTSPRYWQSLYACTLYQSPYCCWQSLYGCMLLLIMIRPYVCICSIGKTE